LGRFHFQNSPVIRPWDDLCKIRISTLNF